jgi:hypothetical protein
LEFRRGRAWTFEARRVDIGFQRGREGAGPGRLAAAAKLRWGAAMTQTVPKASGYHVNTVKITGITGPMVISGSGPAGKPCPPLRASPVDQSWSGPCGFNQRVLM